MAETLQIHVASVFVRQAPDERAEVSNQLLHGETVTRLNDTGSWLEIESTHDSYRGFIPAGAFTTAPFAPSHKVSVPLTHIYERPDCKSAILSPLFFQSRIKTSEQTENDFIPLDQGGWVHKDHITALDTFTPDFVETAMMFEAAPYVWGGRTIGGIDCSGLVQVSLMQAGRPCPRDAKDQVGVLGTERPPENIQRGDLVFFDGHVGIMLDDTRILNATARHMKTVIEPLTDLQKDYKNMRIIRPESKA